MAFKFEQLRVWQKAMEISLLVHQVASKFPKEEIYILNSQIKRAADSVALNIAEGSTGQTDAEQNRFLGMALRSAIEVVCCLHLAKGRDIIGEEDFQKLYFHLQELIKSIQTFRKTIKTNK
jgi:four helix bundle protein